VVVFHHCHVLESIIKLGLYDHSKRKILVIATRQCSSE
jgi:hypothetical protein